MTSEAAAERWLTGLRDQVLGGGEVPGWSRGPGSSLKWRGEGVEVVVTPTMQRSPLPLGFGVHAEYTVTGAPSSAERGAVRRRVLELLDRLRASVANAARAENPADLPAVLRAGAAGVRAELSPAVRGAPEALVHVVAACYSDAIEAGERWATPVEMAPCLSLAQRPRFAANAGVDLPLERPSPCDRCGAAALCLMSTGARGQARPLRPLCHADDDAAARAALAVVVEAFGGAGPLRARVLGTLAACTARRRQLGDAGFPPFELSLKRRGRQLLPVVRFVDYGPEGGVAPAGPRQLRERGEQIEAEVERWLGATAARDLRAFCGALERAQRAFVPLSLGFEVCATTGATRLQVYAHLPGQAPARQRGAAAACLEACVGPSASVPEVIGASGAPLELVAWSAGPAEPPALKLYVRLPANHVDRALPATELGALGLFAASHGLCVFECGPKGVGFVKRDFPIVTHFQRAAPLAEAFADGLTARDRAVALKVLSGEAFAAWPTWMSAGLNERVAEQTLYFVPR